jgi:hypothetical protein
MSVCLKVDFGWPASYKTFVSQMHDRLIGSDASYFMTFDSSGMPVVKHVNGDEQASTMNFATGGDYVYLDTYSPSHPSRFLCYSYTGTKRWSLDRQTYANALIADKAGNSYTFEYEDQGEMVTKRDTNAAIIWEKRLPGQYSRRGFISGDSIVMVGITTLKSSAVRQICSITLLSATTGEVFHQRTFDMCPDSRQEFTHVMSDGSHLFIGGHCGDQYKKYFMLKLSEPSELVGLRDSEAPDCRILRPREAMFRVEFNDDRLGRCGVVLRDFAGAEVFNRCYSDGEPVVVSTGSLAGGIYSLEIRSADGLQLRKKIVIE